MDESVENSVVGQVFNSAGRIGPKATHGALNNSPWADAGAEVPKAVEAEGMLLTTREDLRVFEDAPADGAVQLLPESLELIVRLTLKNIGKFHSLKHE